MTHLHDPNRVIHPDPNVRMRMVNAALDMFSVGVGLPKFLAAVAKGNIPLVRELVEAGADVNGLDSPHLNGTKPLQVAVAVRNIKMVKELIRLGADVNHKTSDQLTALFFAVVRGEVEIAKLLLDNGADINARAEDSSFLYTAAAYNQVAIGELLIERGVDVDIRSGQDETPLHHAVKADRVEFVKMLIAKGADINAGACTILERQSEREDPVGTNVTPLYLAVLLERPSIVDVLLKARANVNAATSSKYTPLHAAAEVGSVRFVNKLLAAGSDVNAQTQSGHTALLFAARGNHTEVAKALLRVDGIKVNIVRGESLEMPLNLAAAKANFDVVKLLVDKGASVNAPDAKGVVPLIAAILGGDEKVIKFLIDSGADVNVRTYLGCTPLHSACTTKSPLSLVKLLLDRGADVHMGTEDGSTPLLHAAEFGNVEMMKCLIAHGADPNASNRQDLTALHTAAMKGNLNVIKFLISKNANVNVSTSGTHVTPLQFAVNNGYPDVAEILLKNGADPDTRDATKCAALHGAALKKHNKIAELLLKYRAAVNVIEGQQGQTPLFIALDNGNEKLAHLLLEHGANPNITNKWKIMPIFLASRANSVDMVKALLSKGAYYNLDVMANEFAVTPVKLVKIVENPKIKRILELIDELFSAVIKNDMFQLGCCVKAGVIINARDSIGRTALHYAVNNGNTEAVNLLLKYGADISYATDKGNSPLHFAVTNKLTNVVEILLAHAKSLSFVVRNSFINAKTTKQGTTALHIAAGKNNAAIVKLLLTNGAIFNAKNISDKTPSQLATDEAIKRLFSCAENLLRVVKKGDGLEEVTRILEQEVTAINARDADGGATPLYLCVSKGHTDIADVLLSNGADYLSVTNKGTTPLHIAASKDYVNVVQTLVKRVKEDNANRAVEFLDATTVCGTAALHVASNVDVVRCLLQAGAMYNIRNGRDKTLLELTQNDDVRTLLQITRKLFEDIKKSASKALNTLNDLKVEDFKAVSGTRNEQGQTLVEVALAGAHVKTAGKLAEKLKKINLDSF